MEQHYDLGKLIQIKEILGGYSNRSFAVWMSTPGHINKYFLRLYNPKTVNSEILFEHALLKHLRANGFTLAATPVACRNHATVVCTPPPENHQGETAFWGLFEFLKGEDKYTWTNTGLSDKELISAAKTLARLHNGWLDFDMRPGVDRVQPRIMEFLPTFNKTYRTFLQQADNRLCDRLLADNFDSICRALADAVCFDGQFEGMLTIPIHCDYHPGNLKFCDDRCVGVFDFDWSKIDYRLFDVALGLVYFTSVWNDQKTGFWQDSFNLFLSTYHQACHRLERITPLTRQEHKYLIVMLSIANLYVLNWDLVDFYHSPAPDDGAYHSFINHNLKLMRWIAHQETELDRLINHSLN